ncbi:hypothetical protein BGW39_009657 [Mortierella sp. 14UC]|nr:hypothetical protein BGW39_009657 [Mortierella sp. 14UC]
MTTEDLEGPETHFQAFHAPCEKRLIQIPVVLHPTLNELYVIWSDISDCFPAATRIQFQNVFIPKLRDARLYRVKPHGIKYHPGIVLDVIYGKKPSSPKRKNRSNGSQIVYTKTTEHHATGATPVQDALAEDAYVNVEDQNGIDESEEYGEGDEYDDSDEYDEYDRGDEYNEYDEGYKVDEGDYAEDKSGTPIKDTVSDGRDDNHGYDEEHDGNCEEGEPETRIEEQEEEEGEEEGIRAIMNAQEMTQKQTEEAGEDEEDHPYQTLIKDAIKYRTKVIINSRYTWSQLDHHSKLFVFLPVLDAVSAPSEPAPTEVNEPTPTAIATHPIPRINSKTKFQLYYLCDCGDDPELENHPNAHWINTYEQQSSESDKYIDQYHIRRMIPQLGDYVMGILEMLKYGVYVDQVSQEVAQRVSLMIKYLESKGIQSCEGFVSAKMALDSKSAVTESMLEQLPPIVALDRSSLSGFLKSRTDMLPFRTSEGNVKWMCGFHWKGIWPGLEAHKRTLDFHKNPWAPEGWYSPHIGVWSSRIKSIEGACAFFELVEQMPQNPVFTVWLDWDLSLEDEVELAGAIGRISAAMLHILVHGRDGTQEETDAGMEHGRLKLTTAGLRNPDIEMFTLSTTEEGKEYNYHKQFARRYAWQAYSPKSDKLVTKVERSVRGGKMNAVVSASDVHRAIRTVYRLAKGFRNFSKLSFGHPAHHLDFRFAELKGGEGGGDIVEEKKGTTTDLFSFLDKRQWRDEVYCSSSQNLGIHFFRLACLTKVDMKVHIDEERSLVRKVIMLNERLKSLTVESLGTVYDPSQAYETCKQALFDHSTIELFRISGPNDTLLTKASQSEFTWTNPNDPAKMRVEIVCNKYDNIEAMFQRYGPLIDRLAVEGMSLTDATAMDKSARRKKKPFAPKFISIKGIQRLDPGVRGILQEVVAKGSIECVAVSGSVIPKALKLKGGKRETESTLAVRLEANVKIWTEFLVAIRTKVTDLSVRDDPQRRFLRSLELQPVMIPDMPRLRSFELLCATPADSSLFDGTWLEQLLRFKGPAPGETEKVDDSWQRTDAMEMFSQRSHIPGFHAITKLSLLEVMMTPEDWTRLLRYVDMSQLVVFGVQQKNALAMETLLQIADALPRDSPSLKLFWVKSSSACGARDDETIAALEAKFGPKRRKQDDGVRMELDGFWV